MTTVKRLRRIAQSILEQIEYMDDNDIILTHPNTYGLDTPFLAVYDGFIEIDNIELDNDDESIEDE